MGLSDSSPTDSCGLFRSFVRDQRLLLKKGEHCAKQFLLGLAESP